ncbi:MAG: 23S rRNA (guanosine(2251)-2'-O)-methyltransferase RlmB [Oscillospiraceae bacterium]|nr:23S rRNA (guanosine(2251)-2'-O)-methyltransferase RlmB [Oscillospiraceae bacterium]
MITGRNAVREALAAGRPADSLLIARGAGGGPLSPIIAICRQNRIPVKECDAKKLDFTAGNENHQGVILFIAAREYSTLDDIFKKAEDAGEQPFIIICDRLEDPHNLGAVIRSAEAAGAHGVVIPEHRSVSLTASAAKAAAGALEYMPVARVPNLNNAVAEIKKRGVWVYAADMDGTPYAETDFSGPLALIIGSEGGGIGRLLLENADFETGIPMKGRINSLNASVAAGILMFEISRQRTKS